MGLILNITELKKIANNLIFTNHAKDRITERLGEFNEEKIKKIITRPHIAWHNTDNSINIALTSTEYIVLKKDLDKFVVITLKTESENGITAEEKCILALKNKKYKNKGAKKDDYKRTNQNIRKND